MSKASDYSNEEVAYLDFTKKVKETEMATLYRLSTGDDQWVPKSLVQCEDEDDGIVGVPAWWARKNGLE